MESEEPPTKRKRVSFAPLDLKIAQKHQSNAPPKDLVATFSMNKLKNWKDAKISEHVDKELSSGRNKHVFYAMKSEVSENVIHVGQVVGKERGVDHVILIRNKTTGQVSMKPVRLVHFTPQWHKDPQIFLGEKAAPRIDYKAERGSKEDFLEQKRKMILEFGSAKKQKLLAQTMAAQERNESMTSMMASVAKINAQAEEMEATSGGRLNESANALLRPTQSSVLPKANMEAKDPKDVYSLETIITPEQANLWKEDSMKFGKLSYQDKVKDGYSVFLADLSRFLPRDEGSLAYRCGSLIFLDALARLSKLLYSYKNKKVLNEQEVSSITTNQFVQDFVRDQYLSNDISEGRREGQKKYHLIATDRDKILAHQLVLILLLGGLKFEFKPVAEFTGSTETKIEQVARALGCKIEKDKKTKEGVSWGSAVLIGPPVTKPLGGKKKSYGRNR